MHPLIQHIRKITGVEEMDEGLILSFFKTRSFTKKEVLQKEEKTCPSYFFVIEGCLHLFFTDDKGAGQTIQFALENWWLTDLDAFLTGRKSAYSIQAIEAGVALEISGGQYAALLKQVPLLESYFRRVYERAYAATLLRVRMISRMPKNEFYELFESSYPDFVQRVPQKILASFLGFTPEYLSELRKKRAGKKNS